MIKKIVLGAIALATVTTAALFLFQMQISNQVFQRQVDQGSGRDSLAHLEDGLHVALCGTGSPMPAPDRAGPCNVVVAGDQVFIVDIGEGGSRNLALMGIDASRINGLFLTHLHSDHIDGIGPLMLYHWTRNGSTAPLSVYGPKGVSRVVTAFNEAYDIDNGYRTAHHGLTVAPPSGAGGAAIEFEMLAPSQVVYERRGLKVTAFTVDHEPVSPAVGYRFDYKGRSLCLSGDTKRSANLERVCKGADLLIHDALQPKMLSAMARAQQKAGHNAVAKMMYDIHDYHASPADAAESAESVGAKVLVLSHLVPRVPAPYFQPLFLDDAKKRFGGKIIVGEDGMLFSLTPQSKVIRRRDLM